MTKKPTLAAALRSASKSTVSAVIHADEPIPFAKQAASAPSNKPSSRIGKKIISGHFDKAVVRQIKQLAIDTDSNIQALLGEALNDLFVKHGLKPIA